MERTHEEATEALYAAKDSRHPEAAFAGQEAHRLKSAVGYITPKDMLGGRQREIRDDRDRKLEEERNGARRAGRTPLEERQVPVQSRR